MKLGLIQRLNSKSFVAAQRSYYYYGISESRPDWVGLIQVQISQSRMAPE